MNIKMDELGVLFTNSWNRFRSRLAVAVEILIIPLVLFLISQLLLADHKIAGLILGGIIGLIATIVSFLASIGLIAAFGSGSDFMGSYMTGFRIFWAAIWAINILAGFAIIGGFVMLIIPGIMLAFQLALVSFVVVLENKRGLGALTQSREYVKGYWWAFLGRYLLLTVITGLAMLIFFLPAALLGGYAFGQLIYAILLLILTPFSVAYQYEIYSNLRRLKPEVAEAPTGEIAKKTESGFLKVSIVVGIVGGVALFILIAVAAMLLPTHSSKWNNQYPGGYNYNNGYPPAMGTSTTSGGGTSDGGNGEGKGQIQISPASGPVGTLVTISGANFEATNTILMKGLVAARNVVPSADGTLSFTVPGTLAPNCAPNQACPQFLLEVTAGDYDVSVLNADGTMPIGTFTVTGAPLAPGTPSADGAD